MIISTLIIIGKAFRCKRNLQADWHNADSANVKQHWAGVKCLLQEYFRFSKTQEPSTCKLAGLIRHLSGQNNENTWTLYYNTIMSAKFSVKIVGLSWTISASVLDYNRLYKCLGFALCLGRAAKFISILTS